MSEKIGRRPPNPPSTAPTRAGETTDSGAHRMSTEGSNTTGRAVGDSFERQQSGVASAQLGNHLQALAKSHAAGKVAFTSEDMAYLANTFAALIRQNPKANRAKRAKLFAEAILGGGRKRMSKLLKKLPREEAEKMYAQIAESLDQSPIFAQLVDNVTDEASKLNG